MEHILHIGDLANIPLIKGCVEAGCLKEHVSHIRYLADIPLIDGFVVA